jgi:CMP-2-keto-3-deoxyoctulosonic acid synthetase
MRIIDALEKSATLLAKIPPDKLLHFIGGQIIWHMVWRVTKSGTAATLATIMVAVAKEVVYDKWANKRQIARGETPTHHIEGKDAIATTLGGIAQWATHL